MGSPHPTRTPIPMRLLKYSALALAALGSSACYHATIETGRAAGTTVVSRPWTNTFIFGLVEAQPIDVRAQCPRGIARVETQLSVVNALASIVTLGLYTPRTVTVTCASGTASAGARVLDVAGTDVPAQMVALEAAAAESARTGAPVFVRF
mgnify:CR=1 FL=1